MTTDSLAAVQSRVAASLPGARVQCPAFELALARGAMSPEDAEASGIKHGGCDACEWAGYVPTQDGLRVLKALAVQGWRIWMDYHRDLGWRVSMDDRNTRYGDATDADANAAIFRAADRALAKEE